jgi:transposase
MKSRKKRARGRPDPVVVRLTDKDRSALKALLAKGEGLVRTFKKARVLQLMDAGKSAPQAAMAVGISDDTARRVAQRYRKGGLELAIHDRPRPGPERALSARQEAAVVAMVCSKPPSGFARWSISLIAKEVMRQSIAPSISDATIGRLLQRHELKPWREKNVVRRRD